MEGNGNRTTPWLASVTGNRLGFKSFTKRVTGFPEMRKVNVSAPYLTGGSGPYIN